MKRDIWLFPSLGRAFVATIMASSLTSDSGDPVPSLSFVAAFNNCSDEHVASRHANKAAPPASLTKLMTLYVVGQVMQRPDISFNLNSVVAIPTIAIEESKGLKEFEEFEVGNEYTVAQLLETSGGLSEARTTVALVMAAANAQGWEGSGAEKYERFVQVMNETAQTLGMDNTSFTNVTGDSGNIGTPIDFLKLMTAFEQEMPKTLRYAMGNAEVTTSGFLQNHPDNVIAAKTGHLDSVGYNLAASVQTPGRGVMSLVIFGAEDQGDRMQIADIIYSSAVGSGGCTPNSP